MRLRELIVLALSIVAVCVAGYYNVSAQTFEQRAICTLWLAVAGIVFGVILKEFTESDDSDD